MKIAIKAINSLRSIYITLYSKASLSNIFNSSNAAPIVFLLWANDPILIHRVAHRAKGKTPIMIIVMMDTLDATLSLFVIHVN